MSSTRTSLVAGALALALALPGAVACASAQRAESAPAAPVIPPELQAAVDELDDELARLERDFAARPADPEDVEWVKAKLAHMVAVDQAAREASIELQQAHDDDALHTWIAEEVGGRVERVDARNLIDLKELFALHGWFRISRFGARADGNGWLLAQHADRDPTFQREVLAILAELWPVGETRPQNYAYLSDRVDVAAGRPQTYGTQGSCDDGTWEPFAIADRDGVDARRAELGLGPLDEYVELASSLCP